MIAIGIGLGVCFGSGGGNNFPLVGASLHADFAGNRIFGASSVSSAFSLTRASAAYADAATGAWTSFGSGALRQTDRGLRIEEGRTNLFLNSLAPVTQSITVASGTAYTVSLSAAGGTLTLSGAGTGTVNANGSVTFTASTTSLTVTCNSLSGSFQCVNVEAAPYKTAPISTAGASASRASDVVTLPSPSTYIPLSQGTVFFEWEELAGTTGGNNRMLFSYAIDGNNRIYAYVGASDNKFHFVVVSGGAQQCDLASTNVVAAGGRYKAALRWGTNDFALRLSASLGSPANDTSGSIFSGSPIFGLGQNGFGSASQFNGIIRQFATFTTGQSDAYLAAVVA